jgi:hypothetical protein
MILETPPDFQPILFDLLLVDINMTVLMELEVAVPIDEFL